MKIRREMDHFARVELGNGMVLNLNEERLGLKVMLISSTGQALAAIGGASNVLTLREIDP